MNIDELLEAASADFFWLPPHVQTVQREAIHYAYGSGGHKTYNRVVRVRPELEPPKVLVDEVLRAHGEGESLWLLNAFSDTPEMRRALLERGYREDQRHIACAIASDELSSKMPRDVSIREVRTAEDLDALYQIWEQAFGSRPNLSLEDFHRELQACTGPDRRIIRLLASYKGSIAGTAAMTLFPRHDFALIWAGAVLEEHRGRGVYTALLSARAQLAASRGISAIGLYALESTSAPIVLAKGFSRAGEMVYFQRP